MFDRISLNFSKTITSFAFCLFLINAACSAMEQRLEGLLSPTDDINTKNAILKSKLQNY